MVSAQDGVLTTVLDAFVVQIVIWTVVPALMLISLIISFILNRMHRPEEGYILLAFEIIHDTWIGGSGISCLLWSKTDRVTRIIMSMWTGIAVASLYMSAAASWDAQAQVSNFHRSLSWPCS